MHHAEALLFVDDDEAEVGEGDVLLQEPVRADDDVHLALGEIAQDAPLLGLGLEARELFDAHRETGEARAERAIVLSRRAASSAREPRLASCRRSALNAARIATSVLP